MSKKSKRASRIGRTKQGVINIKSVRRRKKVWVTVSCLIVVLIVSGGILARWNATPILLASPLPTPIPTPVLAREYIYAGSRLLATEEPGGSAPTGTDLAVWRMSTGTWYVLGGTTGTQSTEAWGMSGDVAAPGDYDGDGKTDFCVFRPTSSTWYVLKTTNGALQYLTFGASGDKLAQADYDGDGRTDVATWRGSDNTWRILNSSTGATTTQVWYVQSTDDPVQGDYDADGKTDIAVWRRTGSQVGYWFILKSSNGQTRSEAWGTTGDTPVPAPYRR